MCNGILYFGELIQNLVLLLYSCALVSVVLIPTRVPLQFTARLNTPGFLDAKHCSLR